MAAWTHHPHRQFLGEAAFQGRGTDCAKARSCVGEQPAPQPGPQQPQPLLQHLCPEYMLGAWGRRAFGLRFREPQRPITTSF